MTTTPTWREALEFAAETKSSDWPKRCQQMVDMARKALMSDLKQKPVAWTLKETIETKGSLYRAPLWFTDPQNTAWVPLYTIGAPQHAEAVPPGYVLVPVEPTPEMIQGFWGDITHGEAEIAAAKEAWRKAIDAALAQQKGQP